MEDTVGLPGSHLIFTIGSLHLAAVLLLAVPTD